MELLRENSIADPEASKRAEETASPQPGAKSAPLREAAFRKGHVLVVDDEPINRKILRNLLEEGGHRIEEVDNGKDALRRVRLDPPDVVLLDVIMPGIDGFEVCRLLKANPNTAHIPVIIVTSLAQREHRLEGIEAGANDFLNKPIDAEDVTLRVRNALYTKGLFDRVRQQYQKLAELEALRDNLTHMVAHDMRSPLTGMKGYLELIKEIDGEKLSEKGRSFLDGALETTSSLDDMIGSMLDVSRLESGEMPLERSICDLGSLVEDALDMLGALTYNVRVLYDPPPRSVSVFCDRDLIRRVISNIVGNSIKFCHENGEVRISVGSDGENARASIADNGAGIPREYHEKIFEKFGQARQRGHSPKYSTGLGLTFCKLAIEAHGGEIGVLSEVGRGSTFWFDLPCFKE